MWSNDTAWLITLARKTGSIATQKEHNPVQGEPNASGKYLQLQFTIEDENVFTTPWTATMTYVQDPDGFHGNGLCRKHPVVRRKERRCATGRHAGFLSAEASRKGAINAAHCAPSPTAERYRGR